jgi:hypothetical protein
MKPVCLSGSGSHACHVGNSFLPTGKTGWWGDSTLISQQEAVLVHPSFDFPAQYSDLSTLHTNHLIFVATIEEGSGPHL